MIVYTPNAENKSRSIAYKLDADNYIEWDIAQNSGDYKAISDHKNKNHAALRKQLLISTDAKSITSYYRNEVVANSFSPMTAGSLVAAILTMVVLITLTSFPPTTFIGILGGTYGIKKYNPSNSRSSLFGEKRNESELETSNNKLAIE